MIRSVASFFTRYIEPQKSGFFSEKNFSFLNVMYYKAGYYVLFICDVSESFFKFFLVQGCQVFQLIKAVFSLFFLNVYVPPELSA